MRRTNKDYKKKLKQRLYIGVICIALGVMMIVGVSASKSDNDFISAFGFAVAMVGVARIIQYLKITKNDESIKKLTKLMKEISLLFIKQRVLHFLYIF